MFLCLYYHVINVYDNISYIEFLKNNNYWN